MKSPNKIFLTNMILDQRVLKFSKINDISDKLFIMLKTTILIYKSPKSLILRQRATGAWAGIERKELNKKEKWREGKESGIGGYQLESQSCLVPTLHI